MRGVFHRGVPSTRCRAYVPSTEVLVAAAQRYRLCLSHPTLRYVCTLLHGRGK